MRQAIMLSIEGKVDYIFYLMFNNLKTKKDESKKI